MTVFSISSFIKVLTVLIMLFVCFLNISFGNGGRFIGSIPVHLIIFSCNSFYIPSALSNVFICGLGTVVVDGVSMIFIC